MLCITYIPVASLAVPRTSMGHTLQDVLRVKRALSTLIPYKIVDIILFFAQYWVYASTRRDTLLRVKASKELSHDARWIYMLSDPIPPMFDANGQVVATQLQSVHFSINSCDQGWCSNSNDTSNATRTHGLKHPSCAPPPSPPPNPHGSPKPSENPSISTLPLSRHPPHPPAPSQNFTVHMEMEMSVGSFKGMFELLAKSDVTTSSGILILHVDLNSMDKQGVVEGLGSWMLYKPVIELL
ncbi:hypothetical protein AGABI1DRAFT_132239 [Agaricus bisporus var. burnettii JB137-S8]|uniref:Uncharacterized protein n=1 Tax=Agaricus bisporus var. burnettii (strain JB137-S8 / ATCC MYA-4627 / FGSC 10392) TaxID=597362 RepID=K5WXA4_AGABU|nr:uncharacterized protein AGABI1DRAFT_132239 [Agaricus bisporus var. burnettii JB137-S8]EKM75453.1 hypothetical protein AGABI1DRAFT_132239 [Agaricus bisporus var. burnettii JB137-S8]